MTCFTLLLGRRGGRTALERELSAGLTTGHRIGPTSPRWIRYDGAPAPHGQTSTGIGSVSCVPPRRRWRRFR